MSKGFTLLELIIVIGILAVLGAVSVLVLNPAQLFAQARDTTRIEDLAVIRNALALYASTVSSPDLDGPGLVSCAASCMVGVAGTGVNCGARHVQATKEDVTTRAVDGTGWIPVNFTLIPGGPALSALPVDPSNTTTYFYSYACDNTAKTFELDANMESTRYAAGGTDDKETNTKDGGNNNNIYELGNASGLAL